MKPILLFLGSLVLLVLVFLSGVIITANVIAEPEPHKFANIDTPDLWTSKPKEVDTAKQAYERLPDAPPPKIQTTVNEPPKSIAPVAQPAPQIGSANSENPSLTSTVDRTMTASIPGNPTQPEPIDPSQPIPDANNSMQPVQSRNSTVDAASAQFCYARYRSYRVEDNSYQPFDGGPRRQCQAPDAPQANAAIPSEEAPAARDSAATPEPSNSRVQAGPRELPPLPPESIPTDDEWNAAERVHSDPHVIEGASPVGSEAVPAAGSHEEWCANRYRSYSANDNSYQPFDGSSRRACESPFG